MPDCSLCKDQGWIPDPRDYKIHIECTACMRPKRLAREYEAANLPIFVRDIEWSNIEVTDDRKTLVRGARTWLKGAYSMHGPHGEFKPKSKTQARAKRNFLIFGPPTSGKTLLASLMAKTLIKRSVGVYRGHLEKYTAAFFVKLGTPEAEAEMALRARMREIPVLIFEFGDEPDHRYSGPKFVELLKCRMEKGLCTILISALNPDRIVRKYGGDFCKSTELIRLVKNQKFVTAYSLGIST